MDTYFSFLPEELIKIILIDLSDFSSVKNLTRALKFYVDYKELISLRYPDLYLDLLGVSKFIDIEVEYEYTNLYKQLLQYNFDGNMDKFITLVIPSSLKNLISMILLYSKGDNKFEDILKSPKDDLKYYYIYTSLYIPNPCYDEKAYLYFRSITKF